MKRRTIATVITVLGIVLVVSGLLLMFALVVANGISSSNLISFEDIWARITSDFSGFLLLIQEHLKDWGLLSEDRPTMQASMACPRK